MSKTQIKKWGDSFIVVLDPKFMKFHRLKCGDWVDLSDLVKIKPKKQRK